MQQTTRTMWLVWISGILLHHKGWLDRHFIRMWWHYRWRNKARMCYRLVKFFRIPYLVYNDRKSLFSMAPVSFDEFSISGAKVFLCSSPSDCKRNSNFCDFSNGGSGTCVSCPSGGTKCASYLSRDNENGIQACTNKCEWTSMYKYSSHYAASLYLKYDCLHYHNQKITYNLLILQTEHHQLEQLRTTISKRHSQQHLK